MRPFTLTEVDVSEGAAPDLAPEAVLVPDSKLHGDEGELGGHGRESQSVRVRERGTKDMHPSSTQPPTGLDPPPNTPPGQHTPIHTPLGDYVDVVNTTQDPSAGRQPLPHNTLMN